MFEVDKYDRSLHRNQPAVPERGYEPASDVEGMSLLYWGEHCVECAAPACYSSCDLYQPRSDRRCRRFAFGAYKNPAFPSLRGYGIEVSFKKWAKIEAFGNTSIQPLASVLRWERMLESGAPVSNLVGRVINRATGSRNFAELTYIATEKLSRRLNQRSRGAKPEAFLLEVYNPGEQEVRLQIIFSVSVPDAERKGREAPLIAPSVNTVALAPGYTRHEFPAQLFRHIIDRGVPFKITMVPEADTNATLVFLSADLVTFKRRTAASADAPKIKCVVWDLDNTLWDGTLVEGDQVALKPSIPELLKYLDERGILLSVVSKNDFDPAWEKLQQFGVAEYFLYPQIDWLPKGQKIKTIAKRLNIGLDTFAFIDDNPFELDEVKSAVPELLALPATAIDSLKSDPRFHGSVTEESRQRRKMYQEQVSRENDQQEFGDDYRGFLASCGIVLEIGGYSERDSERVAELVQRTNQLNFSGRKYSRAEFEEVLHDAALGKYVLRCADKYGSYGTVGFCLVRNQPAAIEILDFMLSCRVQSKFIEQALFSHLLAHHNPHGAQSVWVNFRKTERNTPALNVLRTIGFRQCDSATEGVDRGMILHTAEPLKCDFITVRCSSPARERTPSYAKASDASAA